MAIRITKVYTRTGDDGDTALVGGRRVAKDSLRIEAYGTLDELNSVLGLARVFNAQGKRTAARRRIDEILRGLQNEVFDLGSELATPADFTYEGMFRVGESEVVGLEKAMDAMQKELEPLNSFVLPGGGPVSGFLHQARTICRRAERIVLGLSRSEKLGPWPLRYLNRLSDYLFVLSRWAGKKAGEREYLWERGLRAHTRNRPAAAKRSR